MNTRRYILLALLIAVAIFDYIRIHKRHQAAEQQPAQVSVATSSAPTTPQGAAAWSAYEHAASLRNASPNEFSPAMDAFSTAKAQVPATQGTYDAQDLDTCRMWLMQYRSGGSMKAMATHHIDDCAKLHRDVAQ